MSAGNLYRTFSSKEELVSGLAERDQAALAEDFARLEASADPLAAMGALLRKHLVAAPRACSQLALEIWAEAGRNPAVAAICRGIEEDVHGRLTALVAELSRAAGVEADFAVRVMLTVTAGLFKRHATEARFDGEAEVALALGIYHALFSGAVRPLAGGRRGAPGMKLFPRLILAVAALVLGAAALAAVVPASRPALRAGLDRAGLARYGDRWLGPGVLADRPTDRAESPAGAPASAVPLPPAVTVVKAETREFRDRLHVSGTLVAREEAMVGPQIDGLRVTELLADDGDRVARGQVLARLDRSQLDALAAESDASTARADAAVAQAQNAIQQFDAANAPGPGRLCPLDTPRGRRAVAVRHGRAGLDGPRRRGPARRRPLGPGGRGGRSAQPGGAAPRARRPHRPHRGPRARRRHRQPPLGAARCPVVERRRGAVPHHGRRRRRPRRRGSRRTASPASGSACRPPSRCPAIPCRCPARCG